MELALGLGMTVRELKDKLSYEEAMQWGLYRKKNGPFSIQKRVEYGFALLAAIQTGSKDLKKFIPWLSEQEVEITPEMMLAQLKTVSVKNKVREKADG